MDIKLVVPSSILKIDPAIVLGTLITYTSSLASSTVIAPVNALVSSNKGVYGIVVCPDPAVNAINLNSISF